MESRVTELLITVRAPPDGAPSAADAEGLVQRVLEALAEQVAARWPGRVVLVRELMLNWALPAGSLAGDTEVRELAAAVVEALAAEIEQAGEAPAAGATVATFEDEAAYLAAYLASFERPGGSSEWYFAPVAAEFPRAASATVWAALARLWRSNRLPEVLSALPYSWRERIIEVTSVDGAVAAHHPGELPVSLVSAARALPRSVDDGAAHVCLAAAAASLLPRSSPGERTAAARALLPIWQASHTAALTASTNSPFAADQVASPGNEFATGWGGAVYLLSLAMELGLGDILWRACLPEGALFARSLALVLGARASDDALLPLLAGPGGESPTDARVSAEQQEETSVQLLDAMLAAVARHRADVPRVRLGLRHRSADRLLVACLDGNAWPCFAWPAAGGAQLSRGMAAFLDRWPSHRRRPEASPGLAVLDPRGRALLAFDGQLSTSLALPLDEDAPTAALLIQMAGLLGGLWSSRLGSQADAAALAERYFRIPGRVRLTPERLDIVLPMERIDIEVRRAGLDRDPGWIPWLGRRVGVQFE